MSSAFYPLGMRRVPASGYNHHSSLPQQYVPWKGTGLSKTPVGVTSGTIRPLTNKDYGNNFPAPFGKPRPIKHARKGSLPHIPVSSLVATDASEYEIQEVERNVNRDVQTSTNATLVSQMIDKPGSYSVKENTLNDNTTQANACGGVCVYAPLYPNVPFLTENPEPISGTNAFCCNEERKAKRRVLSASTNLKKNYYTTHTQYLENRCKTFEQRAFNFVGETESGGNPRAKPGAPDANNTYVANCYPNGELRENSETAWVARILQICQDEGFISSSEESKEQYKSIVTFQQLVFFINGLPEPNKKEAAKVYDSIVLNPYTGVPLSGPSNPAGCKVVVYKPSNYQFATEGAVSSRTLNLKKNVETIDTYLSRLPTNTIVYKNKSEPCRPAYNMKNGDKRVCVTYGIYKPHYR